MPTLGVISRASCRAGRVMRPNRSFGSCLGLLREQATYTGTVAISLAVGAHLVRHPSRKNNDKAMAVHTANDRHVLLLCAASRFRGQVFAMLGVVLILIHPLLEVGGGL